MIDIIIWTVIGALALSIVGFTAWAVVRVVSDSKEGKE